jgi:predicted ATP-dependent serine protease
LVNTEFDEIPFTGDWEKLIGHPTVPFHIMVHGRPGSGKSTLVINFAHYLAAEHDMKVLFVAKEEGQSGTTKDKFSRLNASHKNIDISEDIPCCDLLSKYDVAILDSVNELNFTPDHIRRIIEKHPHLSTVQIFKATKDGKFLGKSDFAHLVQVELICAEGKVKAEKNRFGGNGEVEIKF